jgi:hypothetical protein
LEDLSLKLARYLSRQVYQSIFEGRQDARIGGSFRAASLKGWQYALSHKEEIVDLILRRYSRAKDREALLFEAIQTEALVQPDLIELGYQNPARWRAIADTYQALGMLPGAKVPLVEGGVGWSGDAWLGGNSGRALDCQTQSTSQLRNC